MRVYQGYPQRCVKNTHPINCCHDYLRNMRQRNRSRASKSPQSNRMGSRQERQTNNNNHKSISPAWLCTQDLFGNRWRVPQRCWAIWLGGAFGGKEKPPTISGWGHLRLGLLRPSCCDKSKSKPKGYAKNDEGWDLNEPSCDDNISNHYFFLCLVGMRLLYRRGVSELVGGIPFTNFTPCLRLRHLFVLNHNSLHAR